MQVAYTLWELMLSLHIFLLVLLKCIKTVVLAFWQVAKDSKKKIKNPRASHQWYKLSLLHDGLELFAPFRARSHLGTEQIPRWQVGVAVLHYNLLTLGALTRAGSTYKRGKNISKAWTGITFSGLICCVMQNETRCRSDWAYSPTTKMILASLILSKMSMKNRREEIL